MSPIMQKIRIIAALAMAVCLSMTLPAMAQQVYRCEINGKVSYSHEPCVGAQAIDTTPTQGMDKMTGKTKKGADVQRDEHRKLMGTISSTVTGLSPEAHMRLAQRHQLPRSVQLECAAWDLRLPALEEASAKASPKDKEQQAASLFEARKAFRDLRC